MMKADRRADKRHHDGAMIAPIGVVAWRSGSPTPWSSRSPRGCLSMTGRRPGCSTASGPSTSVCTVLQPDHPRDVRLGGRGARRRARAEREARLQRPEADAGRVLRHGPRSSRRPVTTLGPSSSRPISSPAAWSRCITERLRAEHGKRVALIAQVSWRALAREQGAELTAASRRGRHRARALQGRRHDRRHLARDDRGPRGTTGWTIRAHGWVPNYVITDVPFREASERQAAWCSTPDSLRSASGSTC